MTKEQILNHVNFDINKAKEIYEWLNENTEKEETKCNDAIIEIVENCVRVQALGEDFVIGLHDLDDGKDNFSYNTLMPRLNELGLQTFTKKQAQLVCFYLDEINDKLKEAGGDPIAKDWYLTQYLYIPRGASADYNSNSSWYFNGTLGCLSNNNRYYTHFRCRPIRNIVKQKITENGIESK